VPSYPIRAVAKITGLSLDTLRAWERRYQAVVPERSHRGRQYAAAQIERLLLLGQLVQKGHAIGVIAFLSDQKLQSLLAEQPSRAAQRDASPPPDILAPILLAVGEFDAAAAADEVSRLAAVLSPRDLVYQVMVPLMHEVGVRWHDGTLAIAQEHMVSQILRGVLGSLIRLFRRSQSATRMVFATPTGENHEFGIQASAMLASLAGIAPVYLGANLPAEEISQAARRTSAQVIVLGITAPSPSTAAEVSAIITAMPQATELWLGGAGNHIEFFSAGRRLIRLEGFPEFEKECHRYSM
jgi:MerR family transcriptional regulator, light-induced transcriptional regulator